MAIARTVLPSPSIRTRPKPVGPGAKRTLGFAPFRVEVEFVEGLSTHQVVNKISQLSNPQVILWYIGCRGLRETGMHFYRDFLISPILESTAATLWLVDLTAWSAFSDPRCSIDKVSSCCSVIEKIANHRIKCIRSAEILKRIQKISPKTLADYFGKALRRNFISESSKHFPKKNILIKDIFPPNYSVISNWYDRDVSESYSVFQYLEGCLLVDEIFTQQISNNRETAELQIIFTLPNDEIKYYKDNKNSFQKDISFLITKRCDNLNIKNVHLSIKFMTFKYGSSLLERPYNAPGKIINGHNLSSADILGHSTNESLDLSEDLVHAF
jgi:hypothetical protein